jgi:hypothetical protein
MVQILVVDGLGGGLGAEIVSGLKKVPDIEIVAAGTNSFATGNMLKAGAYRGATGENAIKVCSSEADIIMGPWGIVISDSLMGEITSGIALAISSSRATKILIPISHPKLILVGESNTPLSKLIDMAIEKVKEILNGRTCPPGKNI